jgi:hypothetical protein
LPSIPEGQIPSAAPLTASIDQLLSQPFTYLDKGHQSVVFLSQDQKVVLKFYRFPSHLRCFNALNRPLSYRFSARRQKIKAYNLQKLKMSFESYRLCYDLLKEESGLLWLHLNKTNSLKKKIALIDRIGGRYEVDIDRTYCLLQKKADLIFPLLDALLQKKQKTEAKKVIQEILHLLVKSSQKGLLDKDAILDKNYGWIAGSAMHIDVGRFVQDERLKNPAVYKQEIVKVTSSLRTFLAQHAPDLLEFYDTQIQSLELLHN